MILLKKYIMATVLFFAGIIRAEISGEVIGRIIDAATGQPLPGANVSIVNTFLGAGSDSDGRYQIANLAPGEYSLKAGYIGYRAETVAVRVNVGRAVTVDFALKQTPLIGEQVVVTGSRQPENLASAAGSIHVIGKDEMARRGSYRVDEALVSVPGITMVGDNVNIRGGSGYNRLGGSRTLVLLDEVPMLTSDLGEANWSLLPITEVEHIEVSKGAASSLYGSGALSGVINIQTKQPSLGHTFSFRQTSGFYDRPSVPEWRWSDKSRFYNKTDLSYSKSFGPVGLRLAVSRHGSVGYQQNGEFERWYFTGKVHTQLPGNSTLTVFSTFSQEKKGLFLQWLEQDHALLVPSYDRGKTVQLSGYVGYAVWNKLFSPLSALKVRLSYNQQVVGIPFDLSGVFTPAVGLGGELQWNWKPRPAHSLSLGLNYKYDTVQSTYYGAQSANGVSPYLQEIWKLSDLLQLNAGLRWDNYILVGDSVETQLSPKIGFSYQPFKGTIVHSSAGRAFRAATVVERFLEAGSSDFRWKSNPGLTPERSVLFDLGVRQNIGENLYVEATWFYNTFSHLIEPTLFNDLTAQFINYPRARIDGIETDLRWQLWRNRIRLNASATWMDPHEIDSGAPLVYRPRFIGYFSPGFWAGPLGIEIDYRYTSRLQKVAIYPLDERVATNLLDARLIYQWSKLNLQVIVRNVLNYNYTVSERVLGEIRNFAVAVSGNF
jgi:outer membrane receptor protein involved in Fe transport